MNKSDKIFNEFLKPDIEEKTIDDSIEDAIEDAIDLITSQESEIPTIFKNEISNLFDFSILVKNIIRSYIYLYNSNSTGAEAAQAIWSEITTDIEIDKHAPLGVVTCILISLYRFYKNLEENNGEDTNLFKRF